MSAFSSMSSYPSTPANVPGCDAWGVFGLGSTPSVLDSSGIRYLERLSTGLYGVSFSDTQRFGGGAYVVIATPEFAVDGREITGVAGYGPVSIPAPNGKTAGGFSGGIRIKTFTYPNGFHTGGGTAAQNDPASGLMRVNLAAFSFASDSDTGIPLVGNFIKGSEDIENFEWANLLGGLGTGYEILNTISKNPFGGTNATQLKLNAGNIGSPSNYCVISQQTPNTTWATGKPWTWSFWARGVNGGEKIVVRGAAEVAWTLITLTKEWKRYSGTEIAFNTRPRLSFGTVGGQGSDVSPTFYVWGFQHEPGRIVSDYVKTENTAPVSISQDARKNLVPGAGGFGADGNTYASTPHRNFDKRRAVAYGTIVIPPNKTNSSTVSAYIENGFNVSGVSAGANSIFDVSFSRPLANNTYCVILSGEYESITTQPNPSEFSLLAVRAGQNSKHKTPIGFRVESMKQDTTNNSWTNQSIAYQSGLTERIHFMVFGEYTQGQSFLTNPYQSFLPVVGQNGQHPNLDYEVYGIHWGYTVLPAANQNVFNALGYIQNKPSLVPFTSAYVGGSAGYFNGILQPDLGITYISVNGKPNGSIQAWVDVLKNVPQSRRGMEFRANSAFFPIKTTTQRERLVQYYAIRDGYTYTSTVHPNGVTNSGFTAASVFQIAEGVTYPIGTTFTGATFSATRRVLGLISDTQAQDFRVIMNDFTNRMGAAGCTLGIFADDCENAPGTFSLYHLGTTTRPPKPVAGNELITNAGIFASAYASGVDPDRAFVVNGFSADMLYDYYGISAGGSSSKNKLVNRMDPEQLRYLVYDPRIHTYKFSPGGGPTSDASPTIASRFMEIYGNMCKRWNVGGTTATSITHAAEILYAHGGAYTPTQNSGATFPYYATERNVSALGYQARSMNNFNPYLIWYAWDQTVAELMWGHYRYIMYSDGISAGIQYSMYGTGNINADNMEMGQDGNTTPLLAMTLTAKNTINSPTIYGEITGAPGSNMAVYSGFKPNPVTRAEKYCINGRTYASGNNYDYIQSLGGVNYFVIPNGCKKFYPKTAVGDVANSTYSGTDVQFDLGSGAGKTGAIWTRLGGSTVDSPIAVGATGFTAWGGFTALAGDYIWIQNSNGVTNSTPLTIAENIGIVSSGTKRRIGVLESLVDYGITGGLTFTIEHTTNNHGFAAFIYELQRIRAQLRSNSVMVDNGFSPFITGLAGAPQTKWYFDHRYWFELTYHLLLCGSKYLFWFNNAPGAIDSANDGNSIFPHRVLDEWRKISGNSSVKCVTTDPIQLDSEIITSGGRILKGNLEGMHLWRITVRPGTLGFNESVYLTQNSRSDIPKTLVVPGGSVTEHKLVSGNTNYHYGTRGIWLITKSSVPPVYKIGYAGIDDIALSGR